MRKIRFRLRILEFYAAASLALFCFLAVSAFRDTKGNFTELDVERLNIRERNGQLLMVAANSDRMPEPVINGYSWKQERPPGMVFYNGFGDENGGLVFGAVQGNGKYGSYAGLSFDKYKQAQAMALVYNDHSGRYRAGLQIWDRTETPLNEVLSRRQDLNKLSDSPAKSAQLETLSEQDRSPTRLYIGKNEDRESEVTLSDAAGRPKIKMVVTPDGTARLDFLDDAGKVVYSLPKDGLKK